MLHVPAEPVRFVTASSLFDGHDASINIMRRILQSQGAEVVHLGHNRSVREVVDAAVEEDVQGVAVSSYQGGHVEYFEYLVDSLRKAKADHVKVYGGGGGVIIPAEMSALVGTVGGIGELVKAISSPDRPVAPRPATPTTRPRGSAVPPTGA